MMSIVSQRVLPRYSIVRTTARYSSQQAVSTPKKSWSQGGYKKKVMYGLLLGGSVLAVAYVIHGSNLRSTVPYCMTLHALQVDDEIQKVLGTIDEPKWYKDYIYGYVREDNGGYSGSGKLNFKIRGSNGRSGSTDAELEKYGTGAHQWRHKILVVTLDDGRQLTFVDNRLQFPDEQ